MRIAVVGSGIAGLGAAWLLSRQHEVVLFERQSRLGGHTHTHRVELGGRDYAVDTGFIVFNPLNYPLFSRLLDELGVASQPTTMGFSVQDARTGLEYNATSLDGLFCQRRNLLSPRFIGMVREILRFYREAPALLASEGPGPTAGEYLRERRHSTLFIEDHIVPMASALWSSPSAQILRFPAKHLLRFMANHQMLEAGARPAWRVVQGGSGSYVDALRRDWPVELRLGCAARSLRREADAAVLLTDAGEERFDQVVLACHGDQALALLSDPSVPEQQILGALRTQDNDTVLHTDARLLPRNRKAWAAWNAYIPPQPGADCTVSYCMNLLQSLDAPEPLVVSLNRSADIDPGRIIARMRYAHPLQDHASVAAQARRGEINGTARTWYAGAYWGYGFHEDGLRSAAEVAAALGVAW
ncbi:MAG: FAD-dependent oxidoreductase [Arenimonas sp.]